MAQKDFAYTGGWQRFAVPTGVKFVTVTLNGAGSGTGSGGSVSGRIPVVGGQTLMILVGGAGKPNNGATGGGSTVGGGGPGGNGKNGDGGSSGGGATFVRLNSTTGRILAVAGGAGGTSGDNGLGGAGGAATGENGFPGEPALGVIGNATGGTQTQGGNEGTSALGAAYNGKRALDTALITGGAGGSTLLPNTVGGGGGGGGYHPGGGGQAGVVGQTSAGGGGGGANYVGTLVSWASNRGEGNVGNGDALLFWDAPPPADQPPSPPTEVQVGGQPATDAQITRSTGTLTVSAKLDDPNAGQTVQLVARWSSHSDFSSGVRTAISPSVAQTKRGTVTLTGLVQNTRYYARLYTRDSKGLLSDNYNSINFWTNQFPGPPNLTAPVENATFSQLTSTVFSWDHVDPDPNSTQRKFELRWRLAQTPLTLAGAWTTIAQTTTFRSYTTNPSTFKANLFYEWTVRTMDQQGAWGPWAIPRSFYVTGNALAPVGTYPVKGQAVDVTREVTLKWLFRDPDQGDSQAKADIRYRAIGAADWFMRIGTTLSPGGTSAWTLQPDTLSAGVHYEWQARTTDTLTSALSDWSESEHFWGIATPGTGAPSLESVFEVPMESLGCGNNRAFVFDKGGRIMRGEITPLVDITWARKRDDIANCILNTNGFGEDCGRLLSQVHTWMHEIVVFRDGKRVWEGPITRITDDPQKGVQIEAKDVMAWPYRRIMRQGYDDSFRIINGIEQGTLSVVQRAAEIITNALARNDPNLLPYLTVLDFPDDAGQSRVVQDYSKTSWEEVDDMAATAGLDYVAVGRRIMLWDTHRPVGRLPELRSENFSDPPVITEYGMQLATHFGVTNNNGIWAAADRDPGAYGDIEQLASAFGETEAATQDTLTSASRAALENTLQGQAKRNIAGRYPAPIVVRVPDNSTLHPDTNIGIDQLIPGVWVPLRAEGLVTSVAQWQKLDLVTVTQDANGERVAVTMSPAPNGGQDPDADSTTEEAA